VRIVKDPGPGSTVKEVTTADAVFAKLVVGTGELGSGNKVVMPPAVSVVI
jgi:hypothetical protein